MKSKKIFPITRYIFPPLFNLWVKRVTGLENLPKDTGFLLAPNHCSYLEHMLLASNVIPYMNKKLHFIAKREHFEDATQSAWHKIWGKYVDYIPIDREKGGGEALKHAERALRDKKIVVIYPEGTRSLTGKIQKGKTGVARLALQARVPVVPVGIKGTFEILPKGKLIPSLRRASLHFGKPVRFNEHQGKPITKTLLRSMTDRVMKEIARLSGQKYLFAEFAQEGREQ